MQTPNWKAALDPAIRAALDYLEGLPTRPVGPRATPEAMLASLRGPVPASPVDPAQVVSELVRCVEPGLTAMPSGRFFGWVIGGNLPAALAADWLAAAWDQNAGLAEGTPAAAAIEQVALSWVTELLDLPADCSGALVTGAQMANTTCLAAARHRVLKSVGWDVETDGLFGAPAVSIVLGAERHDTLARSLRLLGFGVGAAKSVAVDDQGRMRADELVTTLRAISGPTIVCAQAGNVNSGALDPFHELAPVLEAHRSRVGRDGVWLHVDGAFGLWARVSPTLAKSLRGVEQADSWATDAHKWLNTPYDCGIALVADSAAHRAAMTVRAAYLPDPDAQSVRSPVEYTPDFSRRARGFALYAALRQLGREGLCALIERSCAHARQFASALSSEPGIEVLNEVALNQVVVRFLDPNGGDHAAHTREVVRRVQAEGVCFMSGTVWKNQAAMRISVSNWSTDEDDVARSVASVVAAHAAAKSC